MEETRKGSHLQIRDGLPQKNRKVRPYLLPSPETPRGRQTYEDMIQFAHRLPPHHTSVIIFVIPSCNFFPPRPRLGAEKFHVWKNRGRPLYGLKV